jgi:hypothetical protein
MKIGTLYEDADWISIINNKQLNKILTDLAKIVADYLIITIREQQLKSKTFIKINLRVLASHLLIKYK